MTRYGVLLCFLAINVHLAAAPGPRPDPTPQLQAGTSSLPAGLANAARDKRAFITAASMLGSSMKSDAGLIAALTGAPLEPQRKAIPFRDALERYEASDGFLAHDRIVSSFSYLYSFRRDGEYFSIMRFRLDSDFTCVKLEDLTSVLGAPTRFPAAPPGAGSRPRSDAVWAVDYALPSAAHATFIFGYAQCASSLNVAVKLR